MINLIIKGYVKTTVLMPSLDNLLPIPAFLRIFTVPGSSIPALILFATCNAVFFSNMILSISFFVSKRKEEDLKVHHLLLIL